MLEIEKRKHGGKCQLKRGENLPMIPKRESSRII